MDLTTQNGNNNNGIPSDGHKNVSDSLLDTSELGDEADLEVEKQMQLPGTPGTRKFIYPFKLFYNPLFN
jgi:hypothetical protein